MDQTTASQPSTTSSLRELAERTAMVTGQASPFVSTYQVEVAQEEDERYSNIPCTD
jgi:hypothetical protein